MRRQPVTVQSKTSRPFRPTSASRPAVASDSTAAHKKDDEKSRKLDGNGKRKCYSSGHRNNSKRDIHPATGSISAEDI